jgi:hypothetical protein
VSTTRLAGNVASKKVFALCLAASKVRGGSWIEGAPTHILAEVLSALERDGWTLQRRDDRAVLEAGEPTEQQKAEGAYLASFYRPGGTTHVEGER